MRAVTHCMQLFIAEQTLTGSYCILYKKDNRYVYLGRLPEPMLSRWDIKPLNDVYSAIVNDFINVATVIDATVSFVGDLSLYGYYNGKIPPSYSSNEWRDIYITVEGDKITCSNKPIIEILANITKEHDIRPINLTVNLTQYTSIEEIINE
jgi:hypothetical protein